MNAVLEIRRLQEDLATIRGLLETLPPACVLERAGFEARRDELQAQLDALQRGGASRTARGDHDAHAADAGCVWEPPAAPALHAGVEEELRSVEALLEQLPDDLVLERKGLEERRVELLGELKPNLV